MCLVLQARKTTFICKASSSQHWKATISPMSSHYEVLGLPTSKALTPQLVKAAYRRALLQHHPDKNSSVTPISKSSSKSTVFSVDQITTAYSVLSSQKLKSDYDREFALSAKSQAQSKEGIIFRTGVEVVDLDDLEYEEDSATGKTTWYRSCRCGDDRGYLIKEEDLEEASCDGEIYAGCMGCSLWLKVLFGVVEDEEDGLGDAPKK